MASVILPPEDVFVNVDAQQEAARNEFTTSWESFQLSRENQRTDRPTLINKKQVDAFSLYKIVKQVGGLRQVEKKRMMCHISAELGFTPAESQRLKAFYIHHLYAFESFEMRGEIAEYDDTVKASNKKRNHCDLETLANVAESFARPCNDPVYKVVEKPVCTTAPGSEVHRVWTSAVSFLAQVNANHEQILTHSNNVRHVQETTHKAEIARQKKTHHTHMCNMTMKHQQEVNELSNMQTNHVKDLVSDLELERTKNLCMICEENEREFAYVPCFHFCICAKCAEKVGDQSLPEIYNKCPVCRTACTAPYKQRVFKS